MSGCARKFEGVLNDLDLFFGWEVIHFRNDFRSGHGAKLLCTGSADKLQAHSFGSMLPGLDTNQFRLVM